MFNYSLTKLADVFSSLDVNAAPVGTRMTGTFQRLDSNDSGSQGGGYGTQYGSPPGDLDNSPPSPSSESPTSLQPPESESSECLQTENGVDEHASVTINTTINSMFLSLQRFGLMWFL